MARRALENYKVTEGGFNVDVIIMGGESMMTTYELQQHEISPATLALLDQVKRELIGSVRLNINRGFDHKAAEELKENFMKEAMKAISKKLPKINKEVEEYLVMILVKDMLGLGDIEILLNDPNLEEIVITGSMEPIRVFHKKHGWLPTNVVLKNEMQIRDYFNTIARRVGRQITTLDPLLDAHLLTGDRANAVLFPISSKGNTLTIRKFSRDPWTVVDFIKNKTCSAQLFALIWLALQYEMNILISGGTGSGKTSLLNVCMPFIAPNNRIVSIEDTRELMLPEYLYWCPLTVREANAEGKGAVTMLDLLVNSLRMRPDRIILGEMRKKDQAEVLFEAMHTGHSVYATVHADTVAGTIGRLTNPPIEVPPNLLHAVNLNVVMFRNRRLNVRRVYQVGEFLPGKDARGKDATRPNIIYRWDPTSDEIVQHQKPIRLFEELSRHTGLTIEEITQEIKKKEQILNWLVKRNLRDINSVGKILQLYYLDPENVYKAAQNNNDPKRLIGSGEKK